MSTQDASYRGPPRIEGAAPNILVVRAPFYREVVDRLTDGAIGVLHEVGAKFDTLDVAGAFELPQVIRIALRGRHSYDGFLALGCVIRGETDHYEHICREAMGGLMRVALQYGIALGTGLLTVDTLDQAMARSSRRGPNKGAEAAGAVLLQIAAARRFGAA